MPTRSTGYRRIPSQDSVMSQVSQWDTYRNSARAGEARSSQETSRVSSPRVSSPRGSAAPPPTSIPAPTTVPHPSTMAVPLSTVPHTYIQPPSRKRRGLFSFGVRRRGSRRATQERAAGSAVATAQSRPRFRTPAELDAVLSLADIRTLPAEHTMPLPRITVYAPRGTSSGTTAAVAPAGCIPRTQYITRGPSVRGNSRSRPVAFTPITQTQARLLQLRRSNTAPTRRRAKSSASLQEQRLRSLWQQYLRLVVHQRIRLRLALMTPGPAPNTLPTAPDKRAHAHPSGLSRDDPIVIPDAPGTSSSSATAQVTRRRKAY